ncbi:MAG: EI24 domain-containing protein [Bdellovibrionaceae bacterium]|nr:EI24 domain-containing protein [Pseudobdellovibrionaceae bacterium]
MTNILKALKQALKSCLDKRILFLLFVPFFIAMTIATLLFFSFGTMWVLALSNWIEQLAVFKYISETWQMADAVHTFSYIVTIILVFLILLPIGYLGAVLLVSIFLMPVLLKILEQKEFFLLEKKRGGSLTENILNTFKTSGIYFAGVLLTLPLWLLPGLAIIIPVILGSYLNKKIFFYDVLESYASKEEMAILEQTQRKSLYLLGIILGFLNYLPMTFVVMPVFAGLAYSYFCLNALRELRENKNF